jgi:Kef-type K+ transport system membrane component KefB
LLLITLGVVLILSPLTKSACYRAGLPASVGYIVLGLAIGSLVRPWAAALEFDGAFKVLAQLGVVALLFRVGLRSHISALIDKLPNASLIWIGNVLGSLAVGYAIARFGLNWSVETSLVIATAFSATSVAVSVSVWDELGKIDTDQGQILVDVAELDDLSAAVLLAVLVGTIPTLLNGNDGFWLEVTVASLGSLAKLALFIAGCYLFAHYFESRFTQFNRRASVSESALTIAILGAGLTIAAIADYLGFSLAIGALFAGLAFSRDPEAVHTDARFAYFYDFLTPFFFIYIGMQTDLGTLIRSIDIGLVLFVAAVFAKLVSTVAPALLTMNRNDAITLGVSMIPRAEIALVIMYECRAIDERIVPTEVFAAMVLVSLATCIVSPILLRRLLANP